MKIENIEKAIDGIIKKCTITDYIWDGNDEILTKELDHAKALKMLTVYIIKLAGVKNAINNT